jgi:hypothetical protein
MEFSFYDKIKYYTKYLYDTYYLKMFPYKNVIIYNNTIETTCINRCNNYYNNETRRLNYISWGYDYSLDFPEKRKIVIDYSGNKEFNTTFFAESHEEINNIANEILKNNSTFHKKIQTKFPNFIENVYFIKYNSNKDDDNNNLEVTEIINNSIEYENNSITFNDIVSLVRENSNNIQTIRVVYVKMIKKFTKEFDFTEYKDKDIGILNEIYN